MTLALTVGASTFGLFEIVEHFASPCAGEIDRLGINVKEIAFSLRSPRRRQMLYFHHQSTGGSLSTTSTV